MSNNSEETGQVKWLDIGCNICGKKINSWDNRISITLQYKNSCCEKCIAAEYDMDIESLRVRMEHYFDIRPCIGL